MFRLSFRSGADSAGLPRRLVWGIALGQLIAWGTLYYSFALVIGPLADEPGWSRVDLNAGLTLGLISDSLPAIPLGRLLARSGGGRLSPACSRPAPRLNRSSCLEGTGLSLWIDSCV